MELKKIQIRNFKSIKDSGIISLNDNLFVLAGQNESGKSSILEALKSFEDDEPQRDNLNFELENNENYLQEISCTYSELNEETIDNIYDDLFTLIKTKYNLNDNFDINNAISDNIKIKEFTLTRVYDFSSDNVISTLILDKTILEKIKGVIKTFEVEIDEQDGSKKKVSKQYLDIDEKGTEIADIFFNYTPKIVLFNDFSNLLPDKILLEEIDNPETAGHVAVKNLESLLDKKFKSIALKPSRQRDSASNEESKKVSANFQGDWQQKIYGNNAVNIMFDIKHNELGKQEIEFSVQTKDNELLAPRRRSKGMIWFLSLWLELKAKENGDNLILLFDEPGLHLHIKANKNMLKVFHKLVEKGHQIIYSTHSPSLIETDNLHKIGLVINDIKDGTSVEGLTTSKLNSENKREALQPVAEAMGLEPLKDFSVLNQKNVLLEGLSDFWILKGFEKILQKELDYTFIPGVGIKGNKINPLISFCIGYGFDWLLLMDGGEIPKKLRDELRDDLFSGSEEETDSKIYLISEPEIENLFNINDLSTIDKTLKADKSKKPIDIIGKKRKIIFSRSFYHKVEKGEIKIENINHSTIEEFEKIFEWIDKQFKN
jgi:predicted ATP-dependent endonuclease of OLD family